MRRDEVRRGGSDDVALREARFDGCASLGSVNAELSAAFACACVTENSLRFR